MRQQQERDREERRREREDARKREEQLREDARQREEELQKQLKKLVKTDADESECERKRLETEVSELKKLTSPTEMANALGTITRTMRDNGLLAPQKSEFDVVKEFQASFRPFAVQTPDPVRSAKVHITQNKS